MVKDGTYLRTRPLHEISLVTRTSLVEKTGRNEGYTPSLDYISPVGSRLRAGSTVDPSALQLQEKRRISVKFICVPQTNHVREP